MRQTLHPIYMEQNDLDCDLDGHLDHYLGRNPEDGPVYTGHSLLHITKSAMILFIVRSLFDGREIAIHPISGLK